MLTPLPALAVLLACTRSPSSGDTGAGTASGTSQTTTAPDCWTDLAPGDVQTMATGFSAGTEGLAFVDGRLFIGTPTEVLEMAGDGSTTTLWTHDHVLGLAAVGAGLWVADPGVFDFGGDTDGQIWSLDLDGQAALLSQGWSNPNFLTATPWGTVLMADDTVAGLWEFDDSGNSAATPWLADIESPNGIVATTDTVTVASTFSTDGEVWRAPVKDGVAGTPKLWATTARGGANDGLALGPDGSIWVAVNLAGELWRISPDGKASSFVDGLITPASLGFGQGDDFDPCSLYVTSLYGQDVVRVAVGPS
ncbi:MAG: SMP-30/gluconolactonase/LRE family protein [Oligoflexia bacterium]|nr:SMP-30/gluconolactonase/LRE family protein [Oligoflexia bacterium]